jgi:hypothetical protein
VRSRRVSRGAVLWGLAFVLALNAGLAVAVETRAIYLRDPEAGWRLKRLEPLAESGPVIVALGTSRTQMALDPDQIPNTQVFNFGQAGAGPVLQLLNLKRILRSGVKPSGLIVELLPSSLNESGPADHAVSLYIGRFSARDLFDLMPYCENKFSLWRDWAEFRANPWYRGRFLVLSHSVPTLLPWQQRVDFQWRDMSAKGFSPFPFEEVPEAFRDKLLNDTREQYRRKFSDFRITPTPVRAIDDLKALCERERIPLQFVVLPEGNEFRALIPPAVALQIERFVAELRTTHTVHDCRHWLPERDFADGHHVLRRGALAFSKRFAAECLAGFPPGR